MTVSTVSKPINWDIDNIPGLVSLATHEMFLSASGPQRKPGQPAVIIEAGLGHYSVYWAAVARQISEFGRVYAYDRSGYGASETSPLLPRTAETLALELQHLMNTAEVKPPYVVVAHSFGGVIAREFLALHPANIAGMIFVEANSEFSYKVRPEGLQEAFGGLQEHLNFNEIIKLEERHNLTPQEWAAVNDERTGEEQDETRRGNHGRGRSSDSSCDILGEKKQYNMMLLGTEPVRVIKGHNEKHIQLLLEAARCGGPWDESIGAL